MSPLFIIVRYPCNDTLYIVIIMVLVYTLFHLHIFIRIYCFKFYIIISYHNVSMQDLSHDRSSERFFGPHMGTRIRKKQSVDFMIIIFFLMKSQIF